MDPKDIINEINISFEAFKKANDERLVKSDALVEEKVNNINNEITRLMDELKEVNAKAEAAALNGVAGSSAEALELAQFKNLSKAAEGMSLQDYKTYKETMNTYFRKGDKGRRDIQDALSVGSDPAGGYTVTPDMSGKIITKIYETSPMRQVADVVTIGTDSLEGFNDLDEAATGWVGEQGTRSETATPDFGKWSIPVFEQYAMPKTTQKILDDSSFSIESWLTGKVADKLARTETTAFYTGNGVGKPKGLLTYATALTADDTRAWGTFQHIVTGASGDFYSTDPGNALIDLVFSLKNAYRQNAVFQMSRSTLAAIRKLQDGQGNYLWQPNFEAKQGGNLLGYGIIEAEDMPAIAANSLSIAFGNFKEAYTIVDRAGITVLRDPYTAKGFVNFYTTKRVGGGAINTEAVKFLKFAA